MSEAAQQFAHGYRGEYLLAEIRAGVEHLVPGQHQAIWRDDEETVIELSYVGAMGHDFIVVLLDVDNLRPLRIAVVNGRGIREEEPPDNFRLSDNMMAAITKLKTASAVGDATA